MKREYNGKNAYWEEPIVRYYVHSRDSGCGCTGCLFILFVGAVILSAILFLLGTVLQIVVGIVAMLIRLVILILCIVVGLVILVPSAVSIGFIVRNIVFSVRDAIGDNHFYRKPLAPPFKRFMSRFWGFTKDYWSYFLKHSTATVKSFYARVGDATLRPPLRAWSFLLMVGVAFFTFVAPVLLVILLILRGVFTKHVILALERVTEFFRNLLFINSSAGL